MLFLAAFVAPALEALEKWAAEISLEPLLGDVTAVEALRAVVHEPLRLDLGGAAGRHDREASTRRASILKTYPTWHRRR